MNVMAQLRDTGLPALNDYVLSTIPNETERFRETLRQREEQILVLSAHLQQADQVQGAILFRALTAERRIERALAVVGEGKDEITCGLCAVVAMLKSDDPL